MKHKVDSAVLRLREKESYQRLGTFLTCPANMRRVLAPRECLSLLYRLIGDENYDANLKTVWFVIRQYLGHHWRNYEMTLWLFSQKKIYRKSDDEIEILLGGEVEPVEDKEWPELIAR